MLFKGSNNHFPTGHPYNKQSWQTERGQNVEWHFAKNSKNLQNYSENYPWRITLSKKIMET